MWIALNPGFTIDRWDDRVVICDICGKNIKYGEGGAYHRNSKTDETIVVGGADYLGGGAHKNCTWSPKLSDPDWSPKKSPGVKATHQRSDEK